MGYPVTSIGIDGRPSAKPAESVVRRQTGSSLTVPGLWATLASTASFFTRPGPVVPSADCATGCATDFALLRVKVR
jgi:hypothetical protein